MIEEFKKKLDALLMEYPDIGSFTIKVQPRIIFDTARESEVKKPTIAGVVSADSPKDLKDNIVSALEATVTKDKLEELKKASNSGI